MEFEKYKLETTEKEVNCISLVAKHYNYYDGEGQTHEHEEILLSFLKLDDAQKYADLKNSTNDNNSIHYFAYAIEIIEDDSLPNGCNCV